MALTAVAGAPKSDAARIRQALKSKSTAISAIMREGKVTPGDDRITSKAPRRLSPTDLEGTRIAIVSAQALEDEYDFVLNDTVFSLGWNSNIAGADGDYVITNFFANYPYPLYIDEENGIASLPQGYIQQEFIEGTYSTQGWARYRTDTTRTYFLLTPDYLFYDCDLEDIAGTVYYDGSILFDGQFLIYIEEVQDTYSRANSLVSSDTLAYVSPIYSDLMLLKPNGTHEYNYRMTPGGVIPFVNVNQLEVTSMVGVSDGYGTIGRVIVGGLVGGNVSTTTGLRPKPIDPRKPNSKSSNPSSVTDGNDNSDGNAILGRIINLDSLSMTVRQIDSFKLSHFDFGFHDEGMGVRPKPVDPHNPTRPRTNPYNVVPFMNDNNNNVLTAYNPNLTEIGLTQAPVYMYQNDDSTLCIYNMFNQGYTISYMCLDGDGNMTYPAQPMYYDEVDGEDYYNCSSVGTSLIGGNTGAATTDTISWGTTYPHGFYHGTNYYYNDNKLYFTDGSSFMLPPMLGDVNRDKVLSIGDVTALISHVLSGDIGLSSSFSPYAADVTKDGDITVGDVTRLTSMVLGQEPGGE